MKKIERQGWFDHFQQLFSQADGGSSRECSELDDEVSEILDLDSDVLNQPISEAEVRAAVSKLKTGKACGLRQHSGRNVKTWRKQNKYVFSDIF